MKSIEELEQERKARIAAWEKENQKEEEEDVVELIPPPKTLEQLEQERKARMLAWEKEQSNDNESEQSPPRKSVSKSSTTVEHVAVIVETPKSKPTTSSVTNNIETPSKLSALEERKKALELKKKELEAKKQKIQSTPKKENAPIVSQQPIAQPVLEKAKPTPTPTPTPTPVVAAAPKAIEKPKEQPKPTPVVSVQKSAPTPAPVQKQAPTPTPAPAPQQVQSKKRKSSIMEEPTTKASILEKENAIEPSAKKQKNEGKAKLYSQLAELDSKLLKFNGRQ